jgi:hypothetical protein
MSSNAAQPSSYSFLDCLSSLHGRGGTERMSSSVALSALAYRLCVSLPCRLGAPKPKKGTTAHTPGQANETLATLMPPQPNMFKALTGVHKVIAACPYIEIVI